MTRKEEVQQQKFVEALELKPSFVITDGLKVIAWGDGTKAITDVQWGTAIAIGEDVEARALGDYGTAVVIGGGETFCRMAAGEDGKLVLIMPFDGGKGELIFTADVDGVLIKPGVLYTVDDSEFREFREVEHGTPLAAA